MTVGFITVGCIDVGGTFANGEGATGFGACGVAGLVTGAVGGLAGAAAGGLGGGRGGVGAVYVKPRYSYSNWMPSSCMAINISYGPCKSLAILAIPSGSNPRDEVSSAQPLILFTTTCVTPSQSISDRPRGSFDMRPANLTIRQLCFFTISWSFARSRG